MSDFLQLEGKTIAVFGAANRKSVAWLVGETLASAGARVVHVVRDAKIAGEISGLLAKRADQRSTSQAADQRSTSQAADQRSTSHAADQRSTSHGADQRSTSQSADQRSTSHAADQRSTSHAADQRSTPLVLTCDVESQAEIDAVAAALGGLGPLHGFVHSLAFANYSDGFKPFHETRREDFLQALNISAFSLVALANALRPHMAQDSAVVTIGISTTRMAAENYGYMAPIKAALHSSVVFLAKSFGEARVRFNAVCPGLLKTSASAGIPGYLESYLYAEQATLRKQAVSTQEVANAVAFMLSPRSSGINAQEIVIDAGMGVNYFDKGIVSKATK